jgi:hypothetical protein
VAYATRKISEKLVRSIAAATGELSQYAVGTTYNLDSWKTYANRIVSAIKCPTVPSDLFPTATLLLARFCWPCISKWSAIESRCPYCKERFSKVARKQLASSPSALVSTDPSGPLPGIVLEVEAVPERNQRVVFEDPNFQQWIDSLLCTVCGTGEDEDQLLLCDGGHLGAPSSYIWTRRRFLFSVFCYARKKICS